MSYGFMTYLVTTIVLVFFYPADPHTPPVLPILWNIGALMVLVGGYWFFFFLRVNVAFEGHSPFRLMRADLFIVSLLAATIRTSSPILLGAIGEIYSERSGVPNIGLEGQMLMGALFGFLGAYYLGNHWLGLGCGMLAGGVIALILAFLCASLYANQVVTGVTINVLCLGLTTYTYRALFGVSMTVPNIEPIRPVNLPLLRDIPWLGPILYQQKRCNCHRTPGMINND